MPGSPAPRATVARLLGKITEESLHISPLVLFLGDMEDLTEWHSSWCGNTPEYCNAPDCQINYGPGCDGNKIPAGADTSTITRTKVGSIPYGGVGIYDCVNPGDVAITFDDGPYTYTADLLDKLKVSQIPYLALPVPHAPCTSPVSVD